MICFCSVAICRSSSLSSALGALGRPGSSARLRGFAFSPKQLPFGCWHFPHTALEPELRKGRPLPPTQALHSQSSLGGVALPEAASRPASAALGRIPRQAAEPWWSVSLELALARVRRALSLCLCLCRRLALEVVVAAKRTTKSVAGPNFSHRSPALLHPRNRRETYRGLTRFEPKTLISCNVVMARVVWLSR